jgi:hypothetical protein
MLLASTGKNFPTAIIEMPRIVLMIPFEREDWIFSLSPKPLND